MKPIEFTTPDGKRMWLTDVSFVPNVPGYPACVESVTVGDLGLSVRVTVSGAVCPPLTASWEEE